MMKNLFQILCGLFLVVSYSSCMHSEEDKVDVLIIGGGASGVHPASSLLVWEPIH